MRITFSLKTEEINKLAKRFDRAAGAKREAFKQLVQSTAEAVRDDATSKAPVATGELRDSITIRDRPRGEVAFRAPKRDPDLTKVVSAGSAKAFYAHMVEFGTMRDGGQYAPAQPFMTPAAEAAAPGFEREVERIAREDNL